MKNWTRAPHGTNRGGGEATPNRERNQQEPNKEPRKAGPFRNREEHKRSRETQETHDRSIKQEDRNHNRATPQGECKKAKGTVSGT